MLKKIGKTLLLTGFFLPFIASAYAGEVSVTLTADQTTASIDDSISMEVNVSGGKTTSQPVITHADDFDIQFAGTSSQIQIINGQYSSSKSYRFELTPRKVGTFTVGPAQVTVDETNYQSEPVTIVIAKGNTSATSNETAFVEAEISNKNPYVGEQLLYTIRFYTLVPAQNVQLKTPNFEGFVQESMGDSKSYQKVVNGQAWQVSELQWALSPMSAGAMTIAAPRLTAEFLVSARPSSRSIFDDPFFSMGQLFREPRQRTLAGEPVTLEVKPVPQEGKPADFSGLVGSFQIALQSSNHEVEAGQSTTFTITVKGNGDLRTLSDLKWQTPPDIKVYDDQPVLKTVPTPNGLTGTKTFRKAIVPLKAGDLTLPPVTLNFFDPKLGEYKTLDTGAIPIKILPSSRPETLVASRDTALANARNGSQTTAGAETSPANAAKVKVRLPSLQSLKRPIPRWLRGLLTGLGGVALIMIVARFLLQRRRKKLAEDPNYPRRRKALKNALRRMKGLSNRSGRDFFEEASLILRDFLGDKLGIDGRALTKIDIDQKFPILGFSDEEVKTVAQLLHRCEEGIYGGISLAEGDKEEILKTLKELLRGLVQAPHGKGRRSHES